jgi:hypothetical protein
MSTRGARRASRSYRGDYMRTSITRVSRETMQQRSDSATNALRGALRLPTNLNDAELLHTSLAEVAAREILQNSRFASEVRRVYNELATLRPPTRKRTSSPADTTFVWVLGVCGSA